MAFVILVSRGKELSVASNKAVMEDAISGEMEKYFDKTKAEYGDSVIQRRVTPKGMEVIEITEKVKRGWVYNTTQTTEKVLYNLTAVPVESKIEQTDTSIQTDTESVTDTSTQTQTESTQTETGTQTEPGKDPESVIETEFVIGTESGKETETSIKSESGKETETSIKSESGKETETSIKSESGNDTSIQTDTETSIKTQTDSTNYLDFQYKFYSENDLDRMFEFIYDSNRAQDLSQNTICRSVPRNPKKNGVFHFDKDGFRTELKNKLKQPNFGLSRAKSRRRNGVA